MPSSKRLFHTSIYFQAGAQRPVEPHSPYHSTRAEYACHVRSDRKALAPASVALALFRTAIASTTYRPVR